MGFLEDLRYEIEYKLRNTYNKIQTRKYKKLYADYEDNEYNYGSLKHIWGITSWDNLSGKNANLHTMNDIDITYDREDKKYMLGIETAYMFKNKEAECKYLRELLASFSCFMYVNKYDRNHQISLFMNNAATKESANSIEELYANFKIYVEGYCKYYGYEKMRTNNTHLIQEEVEE